MPTALLSVSNKVGLLELASALIQQGWSLLASGGTSATLRAANIPVEEIASYTGSPEILSGRVKTLHPAVHGGILSRGTENDLSDLERIHARPIELVVANLYPFVETARNPESSIEDAVENIDIGGVALIRAAAKNFVRVAVLTTPSDYPLVITELRERGQISETTRRLLAVKAFQVTAQYDSAIYTHLAKQMGQADDVDETPSWLAGFSSSPLRYGENPHQQARLYHLDANTGPFGGEVLHGKALSYNNLLDLDAAWRAALSFDRPAVAIVKHLSPCGIACAKVLSDAFTQALASDPVSAFGGVIAANQPIDEETVDAIGSLFVECIIAPGFSASALEKLEKRKNLRLIQAKPTITHAYEVRTINQGILWQTRDFGDPADAEAWKTVTERQPTELEWDALRFAWKACMHVKSNAIVLAAGEATVGIGGGQPNRIDCVRIAVQRAGARSQGAVMASDAFFPFSDCVIEAAQAGVTAIVQPGGSIRDAESIEAANQYGIAMVTTGFRHFRH